MTNYKNYKTFKISNKCLIFKINKIYKVKALILYYKIKIINKTKILKIILIKKIKNMIMILHNFNLIFYVIINSNSLIKTVLTIILTKWHA